MPRKLPPFCVEDVDRYGKVRIYLRRKGERKIRIEGVPWSTEFMDAYAAALAGSLDDEGRPSLQRSVDGTWRWLCEQYLGRFAGYLQMTPPTRAAYRRLLEATYDEPIAPGDKRCFRDVPIRMMSAKAVRTLRDRRLDKPSIANATLKVMRQVFRFAIEDELAADNPALKVEFLGAATEGHHTWTVEETIKFEQRHPIGTQAHLAYALLLYTGARVSDVRLFGRQHISDGWLHFRPTKTSRSSGVEVEIPILPALQAVLDQSKADNLTFLTTHQHKPYSAKGLTNRMRDWCDEAGLPQCSAHGLRKAGATIAAENGATERQLMAIYGWTSPKQAARYTQKASRKKLAGEAMGLIKKL
ncbi:site-specific integrase [Kaistia geumhonensis]|uniref:Integrase n=1 Tax=Kaistia geumhonensis TaxID=410839 RepID=A0ABU0M5R2_9HYPH|nr:site-specific integrase [Kaistia geumhonensis]MCX5478491.1 site-specific integrase [Kaistia geumhonensis]MDQ0516291.1 integrase [Kaistia geumhonensis]